MNIKNLKTIALAFITVISVALVQSCSNESNDNTARVQLKLIDAPGDYSQVNVEIIDVQYNSTDSEEGWQSFSFTPTIVDLTTLIVGESFLLADEIIPAGILKQIRLVLGDENTIVIDGEGEYPLNTPSAQQSGLKLNLNEVLEPGFSYTFILDWDVQKSVVKAGNSGIYNLKPVIRVTAQVNSGSISGKVVEIIEDIETAIENVTLMLFTTTNDIDSVASTITNDNGDFLFQGLEAGSYILKIEDGEGGYADYKTVEGEEITVTVGEVADAGTIILVLE